MKRFAICVGLTKLNPTAYDDWDGDCPGCDRDAARFATKCHDLGFDGVAVLVNAMATRKGIAQVYGEIVTRLSAGDLLALYSSGHGGQVHDASGDEPDQFDETQCWWDGEVTDDTIAEYLRWVPAGVRVLHVTDTCNSGSNYRGVPARRGRVRGMRCDFLHFGGCDDGRYSYGEEKGGHFTLALLDALSDARKSLTYREWFERTIVRMDVHWQQPVMSELGKSFADREVLT